MIIDSRGGGRRCWVFLTFNVESPQKYYSWLPVPLWIDASINLYIFSVFLSLGNYFSIERINLELIGRDDLCEICRLQHYSCLYKFRCPGWVVCIGHPALNSDSVFHFPASVWLTQFRRVVACSSSAVICKFYASEFNLSIWLISSYDIRVSFHYGGWGRTKSTSLWHRKTPQMLNRYKKCFSVKKIFLFPWVMKPSLPGCAHTYREAREAQKVKKNRRTWEIVKEIFFLRKKRNLEAGR